MKPDAETLTSRLPQLDEKLIKAHIDRLDEHYFATYALDQVARHLQAISKVNSTNPVEILYDELEGDLYSITICSFDYPFLFSLLTGLLTGHGLNILSGTVSTYAQALSPRHAPIGMHRRRFTRRDSTYRSKERRHIIDRFKCRKTGNDRAATWQRQFAEAARHIVALLEAGDQESITRARRQVNENVAGYLRNLEQDPHTSFYPVQIEFSDNTSTATQLKVRSRDTPAFLFSLSTALSLHHFSIEHVGIATTGGQIVDTIDIVDTHGKRIEDPQQLNQIKLSVLLTKQFTHFIGGAPDPYHALIRFEQMVSDIVKTPQKGALLEMLSKPRSMENLARLLGASAYLWEDFIRSQYENLLPMLAPEERAHRFSTPANELNSLLAKKILNEPGYTRRIDILNEFKDRHIFLIDLDHILNNIDLRELAEYLTKLAEVVVNSTAALAYEKLAETYGRPQSVAGLDAAWAIFGLGKFGGAALGYASDIELLFIYSDRGTTTGPGPISNAEFFDRLVKELVRTVRTKQEGIFSIDMRLRPFGSDGPLASSLDGFMRYFGGESQAHSYERLALVRMRCIGGDKVLGGQVERIRDEIVYTSKLINPRQIQELRIRQYEQKKRPGYFNAKFSPGALVDLEYDVQLLQAMHGSRIPALRTPRIHTALSALEQAGILSQKESKQLIRAYDFLRRLINGLRMLRGSAQDLFLPQSDTDEFLHLARRMGYRHREGLSPAQQLRIEFDTHTALVRTFVENHFGRESLPGPAIGNVADLILSKSLPAELYTTVLASVGFQNQERAYVNLQNLAGKGLTKDVFAQLAILACDLLWQQPDPDMALNNWERFTDAIDNKQEHYERMLAQPSQLQILLGIFSGSQFLADTLIRNPEFLDWVIDTQNIRKNYAVDELKLQAERFCASYIDERLWLNALRRFRRRETLRIGARDLCLHFHLPEITRDLSTLADTCIQLVLANILARLDLEKALPAGLGSPIDHFCILAFGKLGGNELNYSSDVDLLGIYEPFEDPAFDDEAKQLYNSVMEKLRKGLSERTDEGYVFRVDLRLRPYGQAGDLVHCLKGIHSYYETHAADWELQAALKLRHVGGSQRLSAEFLAKLQPLIARYCDKKKITDSIEHMRNMAVKHRPRLQQSSIDIKTGHGGIRDVEFLVQGLQLMYITEYRDLFDTNTLNALTKLRERGILARKQAEELADDYIFLRKTEHFLQMYQDLQTHTLPSDEQQLTSLARRVLGSRAESAQFIKEIETRRARIHTYYQSLLLEQQPVK
ncbi:MAG: glutamate-ammonia-ligase adenylyltransferase [Chitinivibrionales bacterium]|nr:glutamate-ammonia-ligase adenylyltransferase [Chitinivibrionales bacterium]